MKVALITEQYPPIAGGIGTSARRVAQNLARLGANVEVIAFDDTRAMTVPPYVISEQDDLVNVTRVGPFFLHQPPDAAPQITEKLRAALRRQYIDTVVGRLSPCPPEVLMSFYLLNAGFVAQFIGAALDLPVVACIRGNDVGENVFRVDRFAATEWVIRRADAVACVNEHLKTRLSWAWPDLEAKTTVIPNSTALGPSEDRCRQMALDARARIGWPVESFVLVFIGTLREKKGVATLMAALLALQDRDVRLLVVGPEIGPPERELCGAAWDELTRANRIFSTGLIPREQVSAWLPCGDAVVMPSVDDGMANGLLEGMAHGLCPIVSDLFTDIVTHTVNGIVTRRRDSGHLEEVVRALADDENYRRQLGAMARVRVAAWSPEKEAAAYLALLANSARSR